MSVIYEDIFDRGVPIFASPNGGKAESYARKLRLLCPQRKYTVVHERPRREEHR